MIPESNWLNTMTELLRNVFEDILKIFFNQVEFSIENLCERIHEEEFLNELFFITCLKICHHHRVF